MNTNLNSTTMGKATGLNVIRTLKTNERTNNNVASNRNDAEAGRGGKQIVFAKLAHIRRCISQKGIKKTGRNPAFRFNYYQLEDFLPTALQLFEEEGLCPIFTLTETEAKLVIKDAENPDAQDAVFTIAVPPTEVAGSGSRNIYQAAGSRMSYFRRYLYLMALELTEGDAIDSAGAEDTEPKFDTTFTVPKIDSTFYDRVRLRLARLQTKDEVGALFGSLVQRGIHVPDSPTLRKIFKERYKELGNMSKFLVDFAFAVLKAKYRHWRGLLHMHVTAVRYTGTEQQKATGIIS